MPCVINASQTSGLVMTSDLSGVLQLQNNGVAVPPLTVAPAFSASGPTQTFTTATVTKFTCNSKLFDTNSNFDATTNYRFTPTVAGYYQINILGIVYPSATGIVSIYMQKNGVAYIASSIANSNAGPSVPVSALIYLNGTTDYVEAYGYQNSGGNLTAQCSNFSGSLVRSA